jgi:fatty-acyl-CoA synthase
MSNLTKTIQSWALRSPHEPALSVGNQHWTRIELDRFAARAARWLTENGVQGPGDRVAIAASNSSSWCAIALGALRLGATLVPINERLSANEIRQILSKVQARVVVTDDIRSQRIESLPAGVSHLELPPLPGDFPVDAGASDQIAEVSRNEHAVIVFTSGSTGYPKGVPISHGVFHEAVLETTLQEPALHRAHALNVTSFAFLGGLFNSFLMPLFLGGRSTMLPAWDPKDALTLLTDAGITTFASTTIFYERMAALPEFTESRISTLKVAIAGGSPVSESLLTQWRDRGVLLRQSYGLTEGCSIVSIPPPEVARMHPDSCGYGGITRQVRIMDDNDVPVPAGERGEIVVRGPGLTDSYLHDPEATAKEFKGGWLHTGDVGTIDEQGLLRVVGRLKDVIISGGINIYAAELERVIGMMGSVDEVAVIGVPDEKFGETPAAYVRGDASLDKSSIVRHCREQLASYKVPKHVVICADPLPRTALGKFDKRALKAEAHNAQIQRPLPVEEQGRV